jgi:hypothetical protein
VLEILKKVLAAPITGITASGAAGSTYRDALIAVATLVTALGAARLLPIEFVDRFNEIYDKITEPTVLAAIGTIGYFGLTIYRALYKSFTAKAEEVATAVDAQIPPKQDVVIQTPAGQDDIKIEAKS